MNKSIMCCVNKKRSAMLLSESTSWAEHFVFVGDWESNKFLSIHHMYGSMVSMGEPPMQDFKWLLSFCYGRNMNRMSSQCPTSFRRWGNGFKKWPIHAIMHNFSHYDLPVVKKITPICHMKREDGFLRNNIGWEQIPPKIRNVYDVLQDAQSATTFSLDLDVDIATANEKQHRSSNPFHKMTFMRGIFVGSKELSIINHVISTSTIDVQVCYVQKFVWIICHECPESSKARWTGWVSIMILLRCKMLALIFFKGVTLPSPMSKATASPIHNSLLSIVNLLLRPNRCSRLYWEELLGFLPFAEAR